MPLTLDDNDATYQIRGYAEHRLRINQDIFTQSVIISPNTLITDWPPQSIRELKPEHLLLIKEWKPAILLIGTGATLEFPPLEVYGELINQGIGVEIMNTSSACHTYNALSAEGRSIAAALMV
jgi:uncharacterized protein